MEKIKIQVASRDDALACAVIYGYYTLKTAVSFDYEAMPVYEFAKKIEKTLERYPFLVAKEGNRRIGFAYASPFKERPAYNRAVETTIYLDPDCRGRGAGRLLYTALEEELKKQGVLNLNACIALSPDPDDPYLSDASIRFHERMGYQKVAHFTACGRKFDRWYDMIWMEKMIGEHTDDPPPFIPYGQLMKNNAAD